MRSKNSKKSKNLNMQKIIQVLNGLHYETKEVYDIFEN